MTQRSMRRIAVAVALTAATVLAAPAQAAGKTTSAISDLGWLEAALQWMAGQWMAGTWSARAEAVSTPGIKAATDPSTPTATALPPATTDAGHGIDPDG
jgi:hypothetical protein